MEVFWSIFSRVSDVFGFISNICVLILTLYTLYITAFSKRLDYVTMGESASAFFGEKIQVHLKNRSLHSIPITKVFLLKKIDGIFRSILIAKYDQPLIIEAWHIKKIESEAFTSIIGLGEHEDESEDVNVFDGGMELGEFEERYDSLHMNAVICVESGDKIIWVKPYKKAPLWEAKIAYKRGNVDSLCVSSKTHDGKTLSKSVRYVIGLIYKDLNGQRCFKSIYAIVGSESVLLSEPICGFNGLDLSFAKSAKELKQHLCEQFEISKENICVSQFNG